MMGPEALSSFTLVAPISNPVLPKSFPRPDTQTEVRQGVRNEAEAAIKVIESIPPVHRIDVQA